MLPIKAHCKINQFFLKKNQKTTKKPHYSKNYKINKPICHNIDNHTDMPDKID